MVVKNHEMVFMVYIVLAGENLKCCSMQMMLVWNAACHLHICRLLPPAMYRRRSEIFEQTANVFARVFQSQAYPLASVLSRSRNVASRRWLFKTHLKS